MQPLASSRDRRDGGSRQSALPVTHGRDRARLPLKGTRTGADERLRSMKLRALLFALVVSFACVPSAFADGPVFAVVPNTSVAPTNVAPPPLSPALMSVQSQLTADRAALARERTEEQRAAAWVAQVEARAAATPLLSDRLAAERNVAQLQVAADNAAANAAQLQEQIDTLSSELQPVVPPLSVAGTLSIGEQAVEIAENYLGVPYRWGGADPSTGFDCSGLTMYVYGELGVRLRHYAADQWDDLAHVDPAQLAPGDLVFFEPRWNGPGHVGIYIGGDNFVEAPHTGDVVKIASLSQEAAELGFVGAARPSASIGTLSPFGY
jgi:cell wall-associated NlpC family hydrolase